MPRRSNSTLRRRLRSLATGTAVFVLVIAVAAMAGVSGTQRVHEVARAEGAPAPAVGGHLLDVTSAAHRAGLLP